MKINKLRVTGCLLCMIICSPALSATKSARVSAVANTPAVVASSNIGYFNSYHLVFSAFSPTPLVNKLLRPLKVPTIAPLPLKSLVRKGLFSDKAFFSLALWQNSIHTGLITASPQESDLGSRGSMDDDSLPFLPAFGLSWERLLGETHGMPISLVTNLSVLYRPDQMEVVSNACSLDRGCQAEHQFSGYSLSSGPGENTTIAFVGLVFHF